MDEKGRNLDLGGIQFAPLCQVPPIHPDGVRLQGVPDILIQGRLADGPWNEKVAGRSGSCGGSAGWLSIFGGAIGKVGVRAHGVTEKDEG